MIKGLLILLQEIRAQPCSLSVITGKWEQPTHPPAGEWIVKMCVHNGLLWRRNSEVCGLVDEPGLKICSELINLCWEDENCIFFLLRLVCHHLRENCSTLVTKQEELGVRSSSIGVGLGCESCAGDRWVHETRGAWAPSMLARWNYFIRFFYYEDNRTFWFSILVMFPISFSSIYLFFVFLVLLCSPGWPWTYRLHCWPWSCNSPPLSAS